MPSKSGQDIVPGYTVGSQCLRFLSAPARNMPPYPAWHAGHNRLSSLISFAAPFPAGFLRGPLRSVENRLCESSLTHTSIYQLQITVNSMHNGASDVSCYEKVTATCHAERGEAFRMGHTARLVRPDASLPLSMTRRGAFVTACRAPLSMTRLRKTPVRAI